ncbi:MAG: hydantoinase B/oxoprolinase family protein, partial [Nitrospinota bacterium]
MNVSPVIGEIVEGALRAAEEEMEELIGRTARSSPIRDLHDFRAAVFDEFGHKLLGRTYGALVEPVLEVFPRGAVRPGDIFLHNDPHLAQGGVGRPAELCLTAPVFAEGAAIAFVQVFGTYEDMGGQLPGGLPTDATEGFHAGILLPPVRLYEGGKLCEDILRVLLRNSRTPEQLRADLTSQAGACRRGAARLEELFRRYGALTVQAAFADLLASSERAFREELLSRLPEGGEWEAVDFVEEDGVEPGRPHRVAVRLRREADRLTLDLSGTGPQARGPINLP